MNNEFLISNFHCVLNVLFFILCDSLVSEFCVLNVAFFLLGDFLAYPGNSFCTCLKKGESHLKHNSLISTIPFLAPAQGRFSLTYLHWPPLGAVALHSLFLYLDTPPPHPSSLQLAQAIFEPKLFPYKYPNILSQLFFLLTPPMRMEQSVLKRWHIKFRRQGITQKKEYNMNNEVYKRKVDTRDNLLTHVLDTAARAKKRGYQFRRTTRDLCI